MERVNDPADPRLEPFRRRSDGRFRHAYPDLFVAESLPVVERLLDRGLTLVRIFVSERRLERVARWSFPDSVEVLVASQETMDGAVGYDLHRGVVAVAERPREPTADEVLESGKLFAGLEGINDLENLGTIIRSARALSVDGLVLDRTCPDPWSRRVVRVSMGAVFDLPITRVGDLAGVMSRAVLWSVALTPSAGGVPIRRATLPPEAKGLIVLGSEGVGLRAETLERADMRVRIPMRSGSDSLNVAHAAAIAFHHFAQMDGRLS